MGANPSQAVGITAFLLGFTALSGALYAGSILLYIVTIALLAASVAAFRKAKPLENAEN
ncbi:MAG TPA: hypothetical protein VK937_05365 [Candidatus Limnocylindria bacterium]|jgi:hypothetical protein|nr:hypothetical protein [Candidatus Limnocylindria bacterium]